MQPTLVLQEAKRSDVDALRKGLGGCLGIVVVGVEATVFSTMPGLDCVYLTLPQAEAWGSKPIAPHISEVLRTPEPERSKGFPPFVVTGVILRASDPKAGDFVLPLVVRSALDAVLAYNRQEGDRIQTVGFMQLERFAPGLEPIEMGRLIRAAYEASLSRGPSVEAYIAELRKFILSYAEHDPDCANGPLLKQMFETCTCGLNLRLEELLGRLAVLLSEKAG